MNEVKTMPVRLRVSLDATPLLGQPTGVGAFCQGALQALSTRDDLEVGAFAVSWRRRGEIVAHLPANVFSPQRPMPARPLQALWGRVSVPPLEWFIGDVDVVHGTNFVVPPTRRAGSVVSVHDLTPLHHPELCNEATLAYPTLIRKAVRRGSWVHTDSSFVAAEVVEAFAADPAKVCVVEPGIPSLPDLAPEEARRMVRRAAALGGLGLHLGHRHGGAARRTSLAWCAPSINSRPNIPPSASCWPAHPDGARRH